MPIMVAPTAMQKMAHPDGKDSSKKLLVLKQSKMHMSFSKVITNQQALGLAVPKV